MPVTRPIGRAMIVGTPTCRARSVGTLEGMGYEVAQCDDAYEAMLEMSRRRTPFNSLILSLGGLFREELQVISAIKRRFANVEVWLTQTDGRAGALAEAMRLGADGLLGDDGLHRIAGPAPAPAQRTINYPAANLHNHNNHALPDQSNRSGEDTRDDDDRDRAYIDLQNLGEPVLTADELRALLQDQPSLPPAGEE